MAIKIAGLELATAGDIIVAGGAYGVGFAVDALFFSGGATSAEVAGASAIGALSLKYAIQRGWKRFKKKKKGQEEQELTDDVCNRQIPDRFGGIRMVGRSAPYGSCCA